MDAAQGRRAARQEISLSALSFFLAFFLSFFLSTRTALQHDRHCESSSVVTAFVVLLCWARKGGGWTELLAGGGGGTFFCSTHHSSRSPSLMPFVRLPVQVKRDSISS
jgi:hypothetical protein